MINNAREAAQEHNHNYIGTEHILLGLLRTPGVAAEMLQSFGVTADRVDAKVIEIVGCGERSGPPMPPTARAPFTPRGKKALEMALREALNAGSMSADAEHILLSVTRETEGIGARILLELGVDHQTIRDQLVRPPSPRPEDPPEPSTNA